MFILPGAKDLIRQFRGYKYRIERKRRARRSQRQYVRQLVAARQPRIRQIIMAPVIAAALFLVPVFYSGHARAYTMTSTVQISSRSTASVHVEPEVVVYDACGMLSRDQSHYGGDSDNIRGILMTLDASCEIKWQARWVMRYESTDNCHKQNEAGSSAYGCPQITDDTWREECMPAGFDERDSVSDQVSCAVMLLKRGDLQRRWLQYWSKPKVSEFYLHVSQSV